MTSKLRAVFDTSVVVSAVLLPRSVPRQAFDRVQEHGKVLISVSDFEMEAEVGKAMVRSGWIVLHGKAAPRLTTCYVKKRKR
jgi:predicted nucleic acid-binding protein